MKNNINKQSVQADGSDGEKMSAGADKMRSKLPIYHLDGYWDDQDANLGIIKFCGFGKCPNRYAYNTRPKILQAVFSKDKVVFFTKNNKGQLIAQVMTNEVTN